MTQFILRAFAVLIAFSGIYSTAQADTCPTFNGSCLPVPPGSDTIAVIGSLLSSPPSSGSYVTDTVSETQEAIGSLPFLNLMSPTGPGYPSTILQLNEPGTSIYSDAIYITTSSGPTFTITIQSDPFLAPGPATYSLDETGGWQDVSSYFGFNSGSVFVASDIDTPLPAALPLFATGLGALGLLGWRRKRKAQAVA